MKRWTEEEISYIKNNFRNKSNKELASFLNRNEQHISYKLNHLSLTRIYIPIKCKVEECNRFSNEKGSGHGFCPKHWLQYYRKTEKGHKVMIDAGSKSRKSIKGRYLYLKCDAKRRNLELDLTLEEYAKLIEPNICYYNCGNPLSPTCSGLDRLNNYKGYTVTNVIPCCRNCNVMRNNVLTSEETAEVVKLLQKLRKTEDIWNVKQN